VESDGSLYLVNTLGSGELVDQSSVSWTQWVDGSFVVELNTNLRETTYSPCFDVKLRLADGGNGLRITSADSECLYPGIHYVDYKTQAKDGTQLCGPYNVEKSFETVLGIRYNVPYGFIDEFYSVATGYGYEYYNKSLEMSIKIFTATASDIPIPLNQIIVDGYEGAKSSSSVTYLKVTKDGVTSSGYGDDGNIFYDRDIVKDDEFLYQISISYPAANKLYCDKILTHFFDTVKY
jgi:hypothetical protein